MFTGSHCSTNEKVLVNLAFISIVYESFIISIVCFGSLLASYCSPIQVQATFLFTTHDDVVVLVQSHDLIFASTS